VSLALDIKNHFCLQYCCSSAANTFFLKTSVTSL